MKCNNIFFILQFYKRTCCVGLIIDENQKINNNYSTNLYNDYKMYPTIPLGLRPGVRFC